MRNLKSIMRRHISLLGFLGVLSFWQVAGLLKLLPKFILPTPLEILQSFVRDRLISLTMLGNFESSFARFGLGCLDSLYHGSPYG